jgi:hypothetical protein
VFVQDLARRLLEEPAEDLGTLLGAGRLVQVVRDDDRVPAVGREGLGRRFQQAGRCETGDAGAPVACGEPLSGDVGVDSESDGEKRGGDSSRPRA